MYGEVNGLFFVFYMYKKEVTINFMTIKYKLLYYFRLHTAYEYQKL